MDFQPALRGQGSRALNEQLLQSLSKEVVIGGVGCRIIQGDFNQSCDSLDAFQLWRHYGWVEAQCLASNVGSSHRSHLQRCYYS